MKKLLLRSFLLAVVLVSLLFGAPAPAATAAPARDTKAVFSLTDLGAAGDIVMRGPYETTSLRFDLPPTWALQEGVNLLLSISLYVDNGVKTVTGPDQTGTVSGALLDVFFNGKLQQSLALSTGENLIYSVPISADALASPYPDGRFQITFSLDASYDCRINQHTTMKIAGTSQAVMPYVQTALHLDLRRLPWPVYQPRAKVPGPAALVIPAAPTASQLNAAFMVMGAFGRMTNGQLPVTMVTNDQLTDTYRNGYDLIFVGPAGAFPALLGIDFPVAVRTAGYVSNEMQPDDGVVQMAASPWNAEKSLLVIGGNSDAGLVKAAQALTTGNLQTGAAPTYSVVAAVHPIVSTGLLNTSAANTSYDYKLSDLGYAVSTGAGVGTVWFSYDFIIPPGQVGGTGPYLDLIYSYSTLVDPNLSSADVYLNTQRVGSITLDPANPNSAKSRVPLPLSLMRPGRNTVEIAAALLPKNACAIVSLNDLWMTVFAESVLHLPIIPATPASYALEDIKSFPKPFNNDPSLSSAAFVVPQADANAWAVAGQVAYALGAQATGSAFGFETAFDGQLTDEMHGRDLIVVGLPTKLSVLQEFKNALPAYYEKDSNVAVLQSQEVIYRVPAGKDLGYLQLFASPWNSQRAVLTVLGTTPAGAQSAGSALTTSSLRETMRGNFATLDGNQATVVDTRTGYGLGRLVPEINTAGTAAPQQPSGADPNGERAKQSAAQQKEQVLKGLAGILLLMAVMVGITIWVRRRSQPNRR